MAERTQDVRVTKIVSGAEQPDIDRTDIKIKDLAGGDIITASETPDNSGQYRAVWTAVAKWGHWFAGATQMYVERLWLGRTDLRQPVYGNLFRKVEIFDSGDTPTGAKGAARTFTTGAGALATDAMGNTDFDFAVVPIVLVFPYQERGAHFTSEPALSGGDVTFGLAVNDAGENYYADGKCYADILIITRGE